LPAPSAIIRTTGHLLSPACILSAALSVCRRPRGARVRQQRGWAAGQLRHEPGRADRRVDSEVEGRRAGEQHMRPQGAHHTRKYTRETECNLGPLCLHGEIPERPTPARAWQSLVGHLGHSAVTMGTTPRRAEAKGPSTPYHREQHHRHRCGRHQPSSPDAYIIMNNAHCSVAIILWGAKLVRRKPRHCGRRHHQRRRLYAASVRCARLACRRSTAVQLIAHLMRPRPVSAP
jgi:hypothetical protein